MQTSAASTATFASRNPRSVLVNNSRQPSYLPSHGTHGIGDTQFSFGRLNSIMEVTQPSSSKFTSALSKIKSNIESNVPTSALASQKKYLNKGHVQFSNNNNKPTKTITVEARKSFNPPPLILKPIDQQQNQEHQQIKYQTQSFWNKVKLFCDECNCCKRNATHISSSW